MKRFLLGCMLAMLFIVSPTAGVANAATTAQARCIGRLGKTLDCPIPLRFRRGSYGVLVNGTFPRDADTRYYSVAARAGQRMTIAFHGDGLMRGYIILPQGGTDGPFHGHGDTIRLPQNGVYVIQVGQDTRADNPWHGNYTLSVLVK